MTESTQKLVEGIKAVPADVRNLVLDAAESSAESLANARDRARAALAAAQANLGAAQRAASRTARAADDCVRASPWISIGVAAALAAAIGFLVARR